jgi:hypothetical protein
MRRSLLDTLATSLAVLALAGCGSSSPARDVARARTPTPTVSPVPTASPTPDPTVAATPTPAPTASPTPASGEGTGGAQAGDEEGIRVPVDVSVATDRIRASVDHVAAFLPLRFTARSSLAKEVQVVVVRSGEDGSAVGRATLPAGGTATIDVDGLPPGSLEVLSPDLDPDMTAIVRVVRGG